MNQFIVRRTLLLAIVGASVSVVVGCASAAEPTAVASTSPNEVTSTSLLKAVEATVLDQAIVYPSNVPAQVSSSIITMPVGADTGLHAHEAPMYAYILEGELTVSYDGGIVKTYHAGEAIMEAIGTHHNGHNSGTTPVRVLVVNMGAEGVANTVTNF